ncbi:MAG: winged helix-turn-helix domain-containing protein [Lysobacter sp.]|nr:winged helix-turn-helix domain-containing protein [Lysobacter sp.]
MSKRKERLIRARFRIGAVQIHPDRLAIMLDGEEHVVEPRIMEVLIVLAESAGDTLSAETILLEVWKHTHFGDNPVHKAINALRKAFGDDPKAPRYIETIRKRGYRLIAAVAFPHDYRRIPLQERDWRGGSPYVGLDAFDDRHADVFHGRSRMVAECLTAMRRQIEQRRRFVLVVGASGCGKTSLLNAGVIPRLRQTGGFDGLEALSVARCNLAGTQADDPVSSLSGALAQWMLDLRPVFAPQPASNLAAWLCERPERIIDTIDDAFHRKASRDIANQPEAHLLMLIDHAEALVSGESRDRKRQAEFERMVHTLCESPRAFVIMIVRGDYYLSLIEAFPSLADRKGSDGHLDVLTPRPGELAQIIRLPAAIAGLTFEEDAETGNHLDDVLRDAAVAHPDALPLLQHTLQALYEQRSEDGELRFATYHEMGGLEGALAHRAEEAYSSLPAQVRESLGRVMSRMIVMQPEHEGVNAQRIYRSELDHDACIFVEAFACARLFVAELDGDRPVYRVAHEALLRQWPRAVDWTRDNRRLLQARERLRGASARWVREERRDDLLLNSGQPFSEAQEVASRFPDELTPLDMEYVHRSGQMVFQQRRVRKLAIAGLITLTIVSCALSLYALEARDTAKHRHEDSLRLADMMLSDPGYSIAGRETDTNDSGAIDSTLTKAKQYEASGRCIEASEHLHDAGKKLMSSARIKEARQTFERAYVHTRTALERRPDDAAVRFAHSQSEYWVGYSHYRAKEFDEAHRHWSNYLSLAKRLHESDRKNPTYLTELSYAFNNMGSLLLDVDKPLEARRMFEQSEERKREALAISPTEYDLQYALIDTLSWIATADERLGRLRSASDRYKAVIAAFRALDPPPGQALTRDNRLANILILSANLSASIGDLREGLRQAEESIVLLSRIGQTNNYAYDWRRELAHAHLEASRINKILGQREAMLSHLSKAYALSLRLRENNRMLPAWQRLDATIRLVASISQSDLNDVEPINRAVSDLEALLGSSPRDRQIRIELANAYFLRGRFLLQQGRAASAREDFLQAIKVSSASSPDSMDVKMSAPWVASHLMLDGGSRNASAALFARAMTATGFRDYDHGCIITKCGQLPSPPR